MEFHGDAPCNPLEAPVAAHDDMDPAHACWNQMLGEAHRVIQVTLEELAMLASLATAETGTHYGHATDAANRSAYSLLLEPALFRFPS